MAVYPPGTVVRIRNTSGSYHYGHLGRVVKGVEGSSRVAISDCFHDFSNYDLLVISTAAEAADVAADGHADCDRRGNPDG